MKCKHSFSHYRECLIKAKEVGYVFLKLHDRAAAARPGKFIFLRHDIDMSVSNALIMAKIESGLGIASTYFVRVSGKYNPFHYPNWKCLMEIQRLKHELGLHYSQDIPQVMGQNFGEFFRREKLILETIMGSPIMGAAVHDPDHSLINDSNLTSFGLTYHAYSDFFLKQCKYLSDSRGSWREDCMCRYIGKHNRLCILTHPIWWFENISCENY
jgi:hypothetical protein